MKPAKSALRLDPDLIHEAELEALLHKRTTPKQIEYWAEIGRKVSEMIDPVDLFSVAQGIAHIEIKEKSTYALDSEQVFNRVEEETAAGYLSDKVTSAVVSYEVDSARPGLLIRINKDGSRDPGHFKNGKFRKIRKQNVG